MIKKLMALLTATLTWITISQSMAYGVNHLSVVPIGNGIIDDGGITYQQPDNPLAKKIKILVEKAADYVQKNGKEVATCAFNDSKSQFQQGDAYVFAFVCNDKPINNGFFIANPATPQYNFQQRATSPLVASILKAVTKKPRGVWYHYCWYDPETHQFEAKQSYIKMIAKYKICVGSGYYIKSKPCQRIAI